MESDSGLSFLDLLTCGLISMMVLAVILAVTMATGGASPLLSETQDIVSLPVAGKPVPPEVLAREPLYAFGEFFVRGDTPKLERWTTDATDNGEARVRVTSVSVGRSPDARLVAGSFAFSPAPSGRESGVAPRMQASWGRKATLELSISGTNSNWVEASEVLAQTEKGALGLLAWINRQQSRIDAVPDALKTELKNRLRAGGLAVRSDSLWQPALGAWAVAAREGIMSEDRTREGGTPAPSARLNALREFFAKLEAEIGPRVGQATDRLEDWWPAGGFPRKYPAVAMLATRTNHAWALAVWVARDSRPGVSSSRLSVTLTPFSTETKWQ